MLIFPAHGATFTKSLTTDCAIDLEGPIETGDHQRFKDLAQGLGLFDPSDSGEPSNTINDAVCLDSPGGSYFEGRFIAQEMRQFGIPSRIHEGAECFSSCAFIFMAGRLVGPEADGTARYLHVNGKLGFHAPYMVPNDITTYTGTELSVRITQNSQIIADFITFGSDTSPYSGRPFFPISLVAELLYAAPDELAMVDTVEDAARWQIDLYGQREKARLNEDQLRQGCQNYLSWELDRPSQLLDPKWPYPLEWEADVADPSSTWAVINTGGMDYQECRIKVQAEPTSGFSVCSADEANGISRGMCNKGWSNWVPWYYGMAPNSPLALLAK